MNSNVLNVPMDEPLATTLVVTGNRFFSGLLEKFLKNSGHAVFIADSAEFAITQTREHKPDYVLLNNALEDQTALALIPEILIEHPDAAVILLAPEPSISEAVDAIKQGAVDYLEGPLELKKLEQVLRANAGFQQ